MSISSSSGNLNISKDKIIAVLLASVVVFSVLVAVPEKSSGISPNEWSENLTVFYPAYENKGGTPTSSIVYGMSENLNSTGAPPKPNDPYVYWNIIDIDNLTSHDKLLSLIVQHSESYTWKSTMEFSDDNQSTDFYLYWSGESPKYIDARIENIYLPERDTGFGTAPENILAENIDINEKGSMSFRPPRTQLSSPHVIAYISADRPVKHGGTGADFRKNRGYRKRLPAERQRPV